MVNTPEEKASTLEYGEIRKGRNGNKLYIVDIKDKLNNPKKFWREMKKCKYGDRKLTKCGGQKTNQKCPMKVGDATTEAIDKVRQWHDGKPVLYGSYENFAKVFGHVCRKERKTKPLKYFWDHDVNPVVAEKSITSQKGAKDMMEREKFSEKLITKIMSVLSYKDGLFPFPFGIFKVNISKETPREEIIRLQALINPNRYSDEMMTVYKKMVSRGFEATHNRLYNNVSTIIRLKNESRS